MRIRQLIIRMRIILELPFTSMTPKHCRRSVYSQLTAVWICGYSPTICGTHTTASVDRTVMGI